MSERTFLRRPVEPAHFVGRHREARGLIQLAVTTDSLVNLVGPTRIGRTSFLRYVQFVFHNKKRHREHLDLLRDRHVIAPYLDLGLPAEDRDARMVIVERIVECMDSFGRHVPERLTVPGVLEELGRAMNSASPATRYVLLIDRAERLLLDPVARAEDPWVQSAVHTLGKLNEYVEHISLVFSFGVGGELRYLNARQREHREQAFLETVSELLALSIDRIELGYIADDDLRHYAHSASVTSADGITRSLDSDDAEWLLDLAGGHPDVFQHVGRLAGNLYAQSADVRRTREEIEQELPDKLRPLVVNALRRLGDAAVRDTAAALSAEQTPTDVVAAELLRGEGLAARADGSTNGTRRYSMPSRALRHAVQRYLSQPDPDMPAQEALPPLRLATSGTDGARRMTRITRADVAVLSELIDGRLVGRDELREALSRASGEEVNDRQVTQRISLLRKKMADELAVPDAIESVYGEGYRLVQPDMFSYTARD